MRTIKNTNNKTHLLKEFLNETQKLWNIAKEEGLLGKMITLFGLRKPLNLLMDSTTLEFLVLVIIRMLILKKLLLTDMEIEELKTNSSI